MSMKFFLRFLGAFALVTVVYADFISDLTGHHFQVLTPGSSGYAAASASRNRRFSFEPAAVTFPKSAQDVSTILSLCTKYNHKAVARSGGHGYTANAIGGKDGSVVVDLSNFKSVTVDSSTHIATIGTGSRLGDIALALNDNGRALPHGVCPYVGIGGHSVELYRHGGYGFTSRKWGLTLDTITALQVVLANGTIVTASSSNHPDLFFALRGSSSSFGIVTSIQAKTLPAPSSATIFEYYWDMSAATAASAFAAFQSFAVEPDLPQEFGAEIVLGAGSSKGRVSFGITGGWYAAADRFHSVISPLLARLPKPSSSTITPGSYINSVQLLGESGHLNTTGIPDSTDTFYAKSLMTPESAPMSNKSITAFMEYLANQGFGTNTNWFVEVELYGGTNSAINKVPVSATAFGRRSSMFTIQFYTSAPSGKPPFPNAGFSLLDGMVNSIVSNNPPGWDYGAYANYIDDRLANWQTLYYSTNYPRLRSLKERFDPHDILSFPHSIEE
ncbi:hypothetical protein CVT26_011340 [Gymnopilus dilepis]|uniref:FAD-binding PCMH-type domain-containing protein n=1 Tax=Gymnopilus dilepis TaxID=231916 RepID=A0A409W8W2_9AGAR|nr:hypothetical protein CVT26_011340 [Gymnopilus dilepis]